MATQQPIQILLVEDNPADARLAREAFREAGIAASIDWVGDGEQAVAYLRKEGSYASVCKPDFVLLDLNLPRRNGREALADIRQIPELKDLPVFILTTSAAEQDILKAYALNANCYFIKPMDLDEFVRLAGAMARFWRRILAPQAASIWAGAEASSS